MTHFLRSDGKLTSSVFLTPTGAHYQAAKKSKSLLTYSKDFLEYETDTEVVVKFRETPSSSFCCYN